MYPYYSCYIFSGVNNVYIILILSLFIVLTFLILKTICFMYKTCIIFVTI
jgi:hypothetical protein